MKKKKLSETESDKLERVIKKWRGIGLASGPGDVNVLASAIHSVYDLAGYCGSPKIFRMSSPASCLLSISVISKALDKGAKSPRLLQREYIRKAMLARLREQAIVDENDEFWRDYFNLPISYRVHLPPLVDLIRTSSQDVLKCGRTPKLIDDIKARVDSGLQACTTLGALVDADFLDNDKELYARHAMPGCVGAVTLSFYEFATWLRKQDRKQQLSPLTRLDVQSRKKHWRIFSQLAKIAENCFCWWAMSGFAVVCDRPVSKRDEQDRLHCEDGPAISFDDGLSMYFWHGAFVPEQVILFPAQQSLQDIYRELNVETRRIRIERFGWQRYLQETESVLLDSRKNDVEGTAESLMRSPEGKILVCACPSTARVYALQVPREVNTCQDAQNWLSGGLNGRITTAT